MKNELVLFETADKEIKLTVPVENDTVWLNRNQLAGLFQRDVKTIGKHIHNALKEELDNSVVANFATTASDGKVYQVEHYNLDMIISVGYRVKSNRGVEFRKWANRVLKQYIIQGYALNEKRLEALQRTVDIQSKMLAGTLEMEEGKVEGILAAVYQDVFGGDVYPSLEEKAANLLYFMVKDHPYFDGCKRIGASLFLEFLSRNDFLYKNGQKRISDGTLVAITLMIAESNSSEKDVMVNLVINLLAM